MERDVKQPDMEWAYDGMGAVVWMMLSVIVFVIGLVVLIVRSKG